MESDWDTSADAWIRHIGRHGDAGRQFVIDPAITTWMAGRVFDRVLDVGCGEGRLCRLLRTLGAAQTTGIDPTSALIDEAKQRDPEGDYHLARAEDLPFAPASFDLVVTCLSLIDIEDYKTAIAEMARVLRPGGSLLAVNLTSYCTAADGRGWKRDGFGRYKYFKFDNYLQERAAEVSFAGVRVTNWHRPLSAYMQAYLDAGLQLSWFDEPAAIGGDIVERYNRAPWFNLMVWQKPD